MVFFGYTHCPDLCPTTMADLAAARRQLPQEFRQKVVVAFVTEDPDRDSPAVLRDWLDAMDPEFVGLQGGNQDTAAALRELYLPESSIIPTPSAPVVHPDDGHVHPGDYGVDHPGVVYAFGPEQTLFYTGGTRPQQYAEDFALLAGAGPE
ncbi:SCO family protein [Cellulomonas sp. ATA003]|uniref:SCO family protein n=1 Tax=Cellulomonas sp. ATA003 TaxID=3073064 RepID=UPI002873203A|nr:SCO family protein [Cellulomonas sp. ATA003]WNB84763.1 SCO family protein [Cellulomonas sp. ATA003]